MKMMKKLLAFVAAMTMVLSLTACGGGYPKTYEVREPRGKGEQVMTLTLEDDSKYTFAFYAENSNGDGSKAMELSFSGEYTLEEETVTFETVDGTGYYMVGSEKTEFEISKEDPGMYAMSPAQGTYVFRVLDDGTLEPVKTK